MLGAVPTAVSSHATAEATKPTGREATSVAGVVGDNGEAQSSKDEPADEADNHRLQRRAYKEAHECTEPREDRGGSKIRHTQN